MKPELTSLFGVIALGGLALNFVQRREIRELRVEAARLEARMTTPPDLHSSRPQPPDADVPATEADPVSGSGIDWKEALLIVKGTGRSAADGIILRKQISTFSPDRLVAALDELEASELPDESKMSLARLFLGGLADANPRLAVERMGKYADLDHQMAPRLGAAMEAWLKQDSGAALAWLDRWVAGNPVYDQALSRISPGRVQYESAVLKVLLSEKTDLVAKRVSTMPQEEAMRLLNKFAFHGPEAGEQFAFAELVRQSLPQAECSEILGAKAEVLAKAGLDEVSAYFDRIRPSEVELKECLNAVVESRMTADSSEPDLEKEIEEMKEWVTGLDPAEADALTGVAFGKALNGRSLDFDEVAPMVMKFQEEAGNDEILHAFLKNGGCCHGSRSLELAAKIADPEMREEVVRHINSHH